MGGWRKTIIIFLTYFVYKYKNKTNSYTKRGKEEGMAIEGFPVTIYEKTNLIY